VAYTAALRGGCHWSQKVRLRRRLRAAMRTIEMTPQAAPVFHNYDRTPWFIAATRIVAVSLAELLLLPAWYLAADLAVLGVTVRRNVHQVRSIPPEDAPRCGFQYSRHAATRRDGGAESRRAHWITL